MDSCKFMHDNDNSNDTGFEMVHPVYDFTTLTNIVTTSCDLVGSTIEHAINRKMDLEFEMVDHPNNQDTTTLNDMITSTTELIDTTIEDATNNKTTLASTMDLVIGLMRQVESEEKAAGQAKAEAAISGLYIRLKAEELKQAQQRAKETNETHAKEVYSQKDVIATEMKELQSRVSDVLHEGSKSVTVLDGMCIALEKRLASALKEKELAEKEKLEKETFAREALAYEESQMEKLVQESERLKQEAMNNSKLQQFLVDRGNLVDTLDGDNSKKCQDIKLLKESLDEEAVLVEVLSTQTSPIIASSSSPSTKEIQNETADSCLVTDKNLGSGLNCSTGDHVQSATKKPLEIGKLVTLVAATERKLFTDKIPNEKNEPADSRTTLDKNFVFGLNWSAGGHVQSATQKPIESGKPVTLDISQEHKLLANEIPNEKNVTADSSVTLDKNFVFGLKLSTGDNVQSVTQKPVERGSSVTSVASPVHKVSTNETDDLKSADIAKVGNEKSTENWVSSFGQTYAKGINWVPFGQTYAKVGNEKPTENWVAYPRFPLCSSNKEGRSKKGKVVTRSGRRMVIM